MQLSGNTWDSPAANGVGSGGDQDKQADGHRPGQWRADERTRLGPGPPLAGHAPRGPPADGRPRPTFAHRWTREDGRGGPHHADSDRQAAICCACPSIADLAHSPCLPRAAPSHKDRSALERIAAVWQPLLAMQSSLLPDWACQIRIVHIQACRPFALPLVAAWRTGQQ